MSAALGPLRIPAFRRLTGAYALNRLGDMVALIAMAIVVWDRTRSVWATTALFAALEFVPGLLAPALTARLDRVPVARVLGVLYAVEAAIFCVLATLTHAFSLGPFLALVAVDGVLAVVTRAICRGAVAALLEPAGQLREGNALLNLAVSPTLALGAAFGAGLVATLGADAALLVNAGTFAAGAAAAVTARGLPRHCSAEDGEPGHWRERLRDALGYMRGHPLVTALLLGQGAATAFFAMTEPIEVVYTRDSLGAGPGGYGALVAAWGAGVILGSVVYTCAARRSLAAALALSTLLQGAALVALGAAPGIEVACAIAVVGGTANGAQGAALITALQEATDIAYQVRVMSFFEALATVAPGIGYLLGGAIAASAGGRLAFVVAGAGVFVVAGTVALARPWRSRVAEGANMPRPLHLSPDRGALGATEGAHMPRSHM
jgi:predicted MFS family arabinose efflux permease